MTVSGSRNVLKALIAVLSLQAVAVGTIVLRDAGLLNPRCYDDVVVETLEVMPDGTIHLLATYDKTRADCEFQRMVVFGRGFTQLPLDFVPFRGPGVTADRLEGEQVMNLTIDPKGVEYDEIEVRVRHLYAGRRIDSTFLTAEVPDV